MTDTDVLIVGGGPVGLSLAAMLGRFGVQATMVERRPGAATHPRARSINLRTTEIYRLFGILDELRAVSLPEAWTREIVYTDRLAGRELGRMQAATQGIVDGRAMSPSPWLLSSQDQFEPVIRRFAETLPSVSLRWSTELAGFEAGPDGVVATLKRMADGVEEHVTAQWMVACDGAASRVRRALGIEMEGRHNLNTMINCQFHADLGRWTDHRPAMLYWTTDPARNVFQKIDMKDRWLCQITYDARVQRPEDFDRAFCADWIRRSVGAPELAVEVTDIIPWTLSSTVAERFRSGRVLIAGDAAHQLPPTGGFGMNTGVQDAHNLAWKLAYVLEAQAAEALIDSYEAERRPVAAYNAQRSLENTRAIGRIRKVAEGRAEGDPAEAIRAARRYGNWLGMDLGLHYETGCLVPDGTPAPEPEDPVSEYVPAARPGHRAPHLWVGRDGRTISLLDLFDRNFVLLLGPRSPLRVERHASLDVWRIGEDLADPTGEWCGLYGVTDTGAVLVRPDGHVAARWPDAADADVTGTLARLLG